jgi:hypothetical protein
MTPDVKYAIDADKIAKAILAMVPDLGPSYEGALAFGMLPAPLMELLDQQLTRKAEEIIDAKYGRVDPAKYPSIAGFWLPARAKFIKDFVRECSKLVSTAMYRHADMVV